ncbi:prostatic acid phosphatase [Coccinella septempunctata]|uniref:prostatic acid phosphatase n=1 Tax=Coccinella septempunctata TaxID=41139 RepID=UPI001D07BAA6|nr:prostatic acid phosphatase [Coccinella septempunctata]
MNYLYITINTFMFSCLFHISVNTNCTTLKQVHLIFRHGERSPSMVFPSDPYKSFWSDGLGYLTNRGKLQMHNLGQRMKHKYSCYLSDHFAPDEVKVLSSYSDRCLMSAQLFNSGFFIPKNEQIWNPELLWQPIPISYKPRNEDNLIAAKQKCEKYDDSYAKLFTSAKYKKILEENAELFEYLTEHTGINVDTIRKVEELYNTLEIEELHNFTLPGWTEKVFPAKMKHLAVLSLASFTETDFMKKMKGGPFLKKILEDMEIASTNANFTKLFLYSGHDITLVNILRTLGFTDILKPNFAAYFIVELHHTPSPEVKIYYNDCGWCKERELKLKNFEHSCTLKDFKEQFESLIPENWQKDCKW